MRKLNLTQKIISAHLRQPSDMAPGDEIRIGIDQTLTHDITAVMSYLAFEALDIPRVRTERSVSYLDHNLLYIDSKTPDDHIFLASIAKKYGIYLSRPGNGICHSVHMARFSVPGKTLLGSDSHTPTCGAVGMLAIGAGGMDVAVAMAGAPLRIRMPRVVRVRLSGRLRPGVGAKDVVLEMLRRVGVKGGLGRVLEYCGDGVSTLEIPERSTISNMGAEMGATSSIFAPDDETRNFFKAQGRLRDFVALSADDGCSYDEEIDMELGAIEPLIACPDAPDNVIAVKDAPRIPIQQVYVGSCTNSSYADIKKSAAILKGRHVNEGVSLTISVSTRQIFRMLLDEGVISDLVDSGARITEIACGACTGIGQSPPTNGASVRTSNRNFKGRAGTPDARIFLVGPEVAAATAIKGVITNPEDVIDVSSLSSIREPQEYVVDDSMIITPPADGKLVEIVRGPNIKPLPLNVPLPDTLCAKVSLKTGDNISTDDITPAGASFSSMRSNIPLISEYAFSRYDPDFSKRAKSMGNSFIIGGENYGQGSSREHAAIAPMYLGVRAIIAKSLARIHRNNLINHGVVPLLFDDPEDYCSISLCDELKIEEFTSQIVSGCILVRNSSRGSLFKTTSDLSKEETEIILCGGLLAFVKKHLMGMNSEETA
jgi:aconitate hydratase